MRRNFLSIFYCGCVLVYPSLCRAQFGRGDSAWATTGADPQRSGWVRSDPKMSRESIQKPEFRFLWKVKVSEGSEPVKSLTPAILLHRYIGYRGFRDLAFVQANGTNLIGIDIDLGRIEWNIRTELSGGTGEASLIAGIARPTVSAFPLRQTAFGPGRGGPARSGVGEPGEGAITLAQAGMLARPVLPPAGSVPGAPAPPGSSSILPGNTTPLGTAANTAGVNPNATGTGAATTTPGAVSPGAGAPGSTPASPGAPAVVPSGPVVPGSSPLPIQGGSNAPGVPGSGGAFPVRPHFPIVIHTLSGDGMFHTRYVSNGIEPQLPIAFVPAGCPTRGFIVVNNTAYVAVGPCENKPGGIRSLDLVSKKVTTWDASSSIAGSDGLAFGPDGTVYVATSKGVLAALDAKTLEVKDTYEAGQEFVSSPVLFQYRLRVLAAIATIDGSLHLLDAKSLGGADHHTPLSKIQLDGGGTSAATGALSSWQDPGGRRWILGVASSGSAGNSAIKAWQIQDQNGTPALTQGWVSQEIAAPSTPMIFNGIIFTTANGSPQTESAAQSSGTAVIHALDGATGKELWNSGKTITASAHRGSLSAGESQIFLGTDDGLLYSFGFWIERL